MPGRRARQAGEVFCSSNHRMAAGQGGGFQAPSGPIQGQQAMPRLYRLPLGGRPGWQDKPQGGGKLNRGQMMPLQQNPARVGVAVMKGTESLAAGSRWPFIPKRQDQLVCLITWVELRMQERYSRR
jgi:hypothetical protein